MTKEWYFDYNSRLNRKLVYHLGYDAGFFSEYNNMLFAMMYCLTHKIHFSIYCDDANFGFEKGWQDYFEPFFEEVHDDFHHVNNYRCFERPITSDFVVFLKRVFKAALKMNKKYYRPYYKFEETEIVKKHKKETKIDLYTQDIWNDLIQYPTRRVITNPCDNSSVCEFDFLNMLDAMAWKFSEKTKCAIDNILGALEVPKDYVGIHVRRGDKIKEVSFVSVDNYMSILKDKSEIKNVYVATDDYGTIKLLRANYPEYRFYSLTKEVSAGYDQTAFDNLEKGKKQTHMISLFADIEMLASAKCFVGSYSSNVGLYIAIRRNRENCFYVDYKSEYLND